MSFRMKYHSVIPINNPDMRKKTRISLISLLAAVMLPAAVIGQDFPQKPVPPRLVNDFAGMLSESDVARLENKLVAFSDSTTTQIAIVTVKSLNGYDKADYAQRLAEKWGIGQKGINNGILILVKPKTESEDGEVYITQGYGLEGAIPDLPVSEIIDREILPSFRTGNYYGGLDKATDILMKMARGEFPADKYLKQSKGSNGPQPFFIIIIIIFVVIMVMGGKGGRNNRHIASKGLPIWMLMSMMNSRNTGGSWGGFSGGGGGGGGFGGFGGGSFGGGGAGGSW